MALKGLAELLKKHRDTADMTEAQFEEELNKLLPETWIPKTTYNELNEKHKLSESQVKELNTQLTTLKDKANLSDEYKKQITDLEEAQKTAKADFDKQVKEMRQGYALDSALTAAKARNAKAVKALLDPSKLSYSEDGSVIGLKEQLDALKKSDAYLFDSEGSGSEGGEGGNPALPKFGNPAGKLGGAGGSGGKSGDDLQKAMLGAAGLV